MKVFHLSLNAMVSSQVCYNPYLRHFGGVHFRVPRERKVCGGQLKSKGHIQEAHEAEERVLPGPRW